MAVPYPSREPKPDMELRDADSTDTDRVRELARSTMTAGYALSPQQLDTIVEERFEGEALERAIDADDTVVLVAENGDGGNGSEGAEGETVVGFVEGRIVNDRGELRWLFVDPEHRGREIGTRLFEEVGEILRENGAEAIQATVLEANTEGGTFFERLGLERVDQHEVEIGEESFVEYAYAESGDDEPSADESPSETEETDALDTDLPRTETREGEMVTTTEDGTETYLDREAVDSGVEAPFVVAYTDEAHTDRYGYYCVNCGSLDTVVDESERIECTECGNTHTERSAEAYDDSYL